MIYIQAARPHPFFSDLEIEGRNRCLEHWESAAIRRKVLKRNWTLLYNIQSSRIFSQLSRS